jgi:TatD DNase family protein
MPGFDSHCHLQDPRYAGRVPEVLGRAREAGVTHWVCCATREADWDRVLGLAREHTGVLPMLGLHPWFVAEAEPGWLERLKGRVASARVGIGECGLDFSAGRPDRAAQEAAFGAQLRLADELDRPVTIHCVGAWARLTALLKAHGLPRAGGVLHAFSGSRELAVELQDLGLHLSFSGAITRPGARRGPAALAAVAGSRLLLETDAPFGPGASPEPADLAQVAQAAASLREMAPEALAALAHANAMKLFGGLLP